MNDDLLLYVDGVLTPCTEASFSAVDVTPRRNLTVPGSMAVHIIPAGPREVLYAVTVDGAPDIKIEKPVQRGNAWYVTTIKD